MEDEEDKHEEKLSEKYLSLPVIADACQTQMNGVDCVWGITYNGYAFEIQLK